MANSDTEGLDVEDSGHLRALAFKTAAQVLAENPGLWDGNSWRMNVIDEEGERGSCLGTGREGNSK
jgi:UTP:GlnB (protein PII) uridylyltransferase